MSLLNPWVILVLICAFTSVGAFSYLQGEESEYERQQLEIAKLNDEARQKEQALITAVQTQSIKLQKANQDAKIAQQKRNFDIDTGALRLRIPIQAPECPVPTPDDAPTASRPDTRSAEIQPETARAILAIGDEADATVRKLNACLAIYNQTREMINERNKP